MNDKVEKTEGKPRFNDFGHVDFCGLFRRKVIQQLRK